ncbi:MAG: histidine phosphatase family protein [Clostridia bacterium]|nr:histidine phosphatase family protein [Clostridia bacterium]
MRIVFIRHGEPDYQHDCLTETGRKQALAAAERLREEGISEIWSSPLGRAAETAEAASRVLDLPVRILPFMREVTWGSRDSLPMMKDGHPWDLADELARQGINLNDPAWRRHPYFRTNRVCDSVDLVEKGIDEWLENLGYRREGYYYRCIRENDAQKTVALFSHGGSSCAAMGHMLNLPFPFACALLHLEFTGITVLRLDRRPGSKTLPCLELANDGRHLREESYHRLKEM